MKRHSLVRKLCAFVSCIVQSTALASGFNHFATQQRSVFQSEPTLDSTQASRERLAQMTAGVEVIDGDSIYLDGRTLAARALAFDLGSFELSRCRPLLPGLAFMEASDQHRLWIAPGWLLNSSASPQQSFRGNFRTRHLGLWVRLEY